MRSNAEILRRLLTEDGVTYRDDVYSFDNISIEPKPGAPGAVLVLRRHPPLGPPGRRVLRRLDAGAHHPAHHR